MDVRNKEQLVCRMRAVVASQQFVQEDILSSLVADACIQVCPKNPANFRVDNVRVAKIAGGGLHNCAFVRGVVLKTDAVGSIKRMEKAKDAYRHQLKLFLYEVKQQQLLSGVRTFLKVYSSISIGKLASYMEVDESKLRTILLTYKHKTHSVDTEGKVISNADVDFYIDDDLISVVESKPAKGYRDYLLRQTVKVEGVMNDMDRVKLD